MDTNTVRSALCFQPHVEIVAASILDEVYPSRSGRTTEMLIEAISYLSENPREKIEISAWSKWYARILCRLLHDYCERLNLKINPINLLPACTDDDWTSCYPNFSDHTVFDHPESPFNK